MAKGNVGYLNVGTMINPADGVSRSLTDLSAMYGRQASAKQAQERADASAAESDRRFGIQQDNLIASNAESRSRFDIGQDRLDANERESTRRFKLDDDRKQNEANYKTNTREAKKRLGDFVTSGGINSHIYELGDNSTQIQGRIADTIGKLKEGRKAFESYLLGDNSPETQKTAMAAFDTNYTGSNNAANRLDARNRRQTDYAEFSNQLRFVKDPKERERLVKKMSGKVYDAPLAQIQNDIDTGKYLLKGEKQNSIIRKLPPAVMQYLDRKTVLDEFGNGVSGMSRDELISRERQATGDYNNSGLSQAGRRSSASVSKSGEFKSSDLKNLTEHLSNIDIGYSDNKDVLAAANDMLDQGHHPEAIVSAIFGNIDENFIGKSFITKDGDKDAYSKMIRRSLSTSNRLKGNTGGSSSQGRFNPSVDRTVEQIRSGMYQNRQAGRLGDYLPKVDRQTKLDQSLLPTEDSLYGAANNVRPTILSGSRQFEGHNPNFYSQGVPEGDGFVMSEEEKAYDQQRREEFDSFGSKSKRLGRDLLQGISTLPPVIVPGLALLKGVSTGTSALVPAITKNSKASRAAVKKLLSDEDYAAYVAKKTAALNPKRSTAAVKAVKDKSDMRVNAAAKKNWNNEVVEKQVTDAWDKYWLANVK
tara:strand:+ start:11754 stop:13691 length:1938 start_codon:yes stop_codon:yes gene_type:complete